jgi:hypothetical protein
MPACARPARRRPAPEAAWGILDLDALRVRMIESECVRAYEFCYDNVNT